MHSASMIRILREFLLEANLQTARPQFVRNISFVFWKKRTFLQMSFFSLFCCFSSFVHKSTVEKCVFPPWKREKSLTFDLGKCALSSSLPSFLPSFDWQRFYCSRYLTRFLSLFLFLSSLASTQMYSIFTLDWKRGNVCDMTWYFIIIYPTTMMFIFNLKNILPYSLILYNTGILLVINFFFANQNRFYCWPFIFAALSRCIYFWQFHPSVYICQKGTWTNTVYHASYICKACSRQDKDLFAKKPICNTTC